MQLLSSIERTDPALTEAQRPRVQKPTISAPNIASTEPTNAVP